MFNRYQPSQDDSDQIPPAPPAPPPGPRRVAVRMPVDAPRLTYALLAIIVLIGLYTFSLSADDQNQFFTDWAKINVLIQDGEYYRLFTSMFLHLNVTHLLFNGYALYVLGRDVEGLFGTARFAVIYFLGGLSGSLASFVFTNAPSVGASGAIFAIFGALMVYFYQHRDLHGAAGRQHLRAAYVYHVVEPRPGLFLDHWRGELPHRQRRAYRRVSRRRCAGLVHRPCLPYPSRSGHRRRLARGGREPHSTLGAAVAALHRRTRDDYRLRDQRLWLMFVGANRG